MIETLRTHWLVASTSDTIREKPVARTILGVPIVLFRSAGKVAALLDRCPHRNAPLSQGRVAEGMIQCPYHGWTFDGQGTCRLVPGMPAREANEPHPHQRATAVPASESHGLIWVYVGPPGAEPPAFPAWPHPAADDPRFDSFIWAASAQCDFVEGIENLLDACHPHFTHAGLVRKSHRRRTVAVTVRRTATMAEAEYLENRVPDGIIPRLVEGERKASIGRFFPPATAQLDYRGTTESRFLLTSFFTPCDARNVLIHSVISTPRKLAPAFLKNAILRAVFGKVLRQDQDALREQQANIDRFGGPAFTSTPLDVLRPHILYFLAHPDPASRSDYSHTLTMEL